MCRLTLHHMKSLPIHAAALGLLTCCASKPLSESSNKEHDDHPAAVLVNEAKLFENIMERMQMNGILAGEDVAAYIGEFGEWASQTSQEEMLSQFSQMQALKRDAALSFAAFFKIPLPEKVMALQRQKTFPAVRRSLQDAAEG
jgi:hypothetical protein